MPNPPPLKEKSVTSLQFIYRHLKESVMQILSACLTRKMLRKDTQEETTFAFQKNQRLLISEETLVHSVQPVKEKSATSLQSKTGQEKEHARKD